jgi:hypothetical protein
MAAGRICFALIVLGATVAAQAGLVLVQTQSEDSATGKSSRTVTQMSLEGSKARSDFLEMSEPNPMFGPGTYMLMSGEKSAGMIIVNPGEKTYMRLDPADFQGLVQMGGSVEQNINKQGGESGITDLTVKKTLDEAGPTMLGMPTRHLVYEISYTRPMGMQNQGFKMGQAITETQEVWATHALDGKLAAIPAYQPMAAGVSNMTSGSSAQLGEVQKEIAANGMILKKVTTTRSKMQSSIPSPAMLFNRGRQSKSVMEITALREEPMQTEHFVLPKGFVERQMMNPNAGNMPDLDKLPGAPGQSGQRPHGDSQMPDLNKMPR